MSKLEEIIDQGKTMLSDLYAMRNEVVTSGLSSIPIPHQETWRILNAHDHMLMALHDLENLSLRQDDVDHWPEWSAEGELLDDQGEVDPRQVLQSAMEESGWTSVSLAEEAGVSRMTVSNFLKGESNTRRSTLAKIENALGLDEGTLDG